MYIYLKNICNDITTGNNNDNRLPPYGVIHHGDNPPKIKNYMPTTFLTGDYFISAGKKERVYHVTREKRCIEICIPELFSHVPITLRDMGRFEKSINNKLLYHKGR